MNGYELSAKQRQIQKGEKRIKELDRLFRKIYEYNVNRKLNDERFFKLSDGYEVSPGTKAMDYFTKLFKYRTAGVREYWIVDPAKEMIAVYRFEKETMEEYSFGEDMLAGIYDEFSIKLQ